MPGPNSSPRRLRVLVAKPGLDGHDRGAKVIARLLRDQGCEVVYTGLRQRPNMIARTAAQEDVDVVGLSILSGAHLVLTRSVLDALAAEGAGDMKVIVGGTVPRADGEKLEQMGVAAVFGVGSSLNDVETWVRSFAEQMTTRSPI
jgi:methylmalonyl-CoA mutase, C-terminal domain